MNTRRLELSGGALALTAVAAIGWLDYVTGVDIGFSLFYLVPIVASAWICGVRVGVIVAAVAGSVWLAADISLRGSDTSVGVSLWNAFTRYVIYISEAVFIAMLRRDRELMRTLAARESTLARTDETTRLANTRAFAEAADEELARARANGESVCVLYIDLDNFKTINDTLGHATGDVVLQQVAEELSHVLRPGDVAARLGGDEFGVLLRGVDETIAERVAERILARITDLGTSYRGSRLGATVGIAYFASNLPVDAEAILSAADALMYEGKREGKGRVVVRRS
jgi:diguanylate cyclase (GGDEF)-like protein